MLQRSFTTPLLQLLTLTLLVAQWQNFHAISYQELSGAQTHTYRPPATANHHAGTPEEPRNSRDAIYSTAVLGAWMDDTDIYAAAARGDGLLSKRSVYSDANGFVQLHGEYIWSARGPTKRPGVVIYHTAAGPRDVFLTWKATALAAMGFVAFIADSYGDANGDKWDALAWRAGAHPEVDSRSAALLALEQLSTHELVDETRLVAMGWCAGGPPLFELLRGTQTGLVAAISFHGVFHGRGCNATPLPHSSTRVLLALGNADPMAGRAEDVAACMERLESAGIAYEIDTYGPSVRHAFTNPGQVQAPKGPNFQYDARAAVASWRASRELLCTVTGVPADACSSR